MRIFVGFIVAFVAFVGTDGLGVYELINEDGHRCSCRGIPKHTIPEVSHPGHYGQVEPEYPIHQEPEVLISHPGHQEAEVEYPEIDFQSSEEQPIIIDYQSSEEQPIVIDAAGHVHQQPSVHEPVHHEHQVHPEPEVYVQLDDPIYEEPEVSISHSGHQEQVYQVYQNHPEEPFIQHPGIQKIEEPHYSAPSSGSFEEVEPVDHTPDFVKPAEIPVYNMIHETQPEEPELDLSELAEVMNPEIDYQSSEEQPIIIDYESSEEEPIIIDAAGHEHQQAPVHKPACCPVHTPVEVPMIPSDASEERDAYISEDRPPIDFEQIGDHVVVMPEHLLPAKVPHCS